MAEHSARDHATWSASATERNWNCAGAIALSLQVEHLDVESEAAAWGTACHQLSEKCLRSGANADEHIGQTEKTKRFTFEVDEEMAECAQEYIDYVRYQHTQGQENTLQIEQHFSLAKLNPPFDAGGTGDAVIYLPREKMIEVIDLKGGRGIVVEVDNNKQLRTYALGAMLANPGLNVTRVKSTIVQPRAPHKDGRIRSEVYHVADLAEWTAELVERMGRSAQACADYVKIKGEISRDEWAAAHLNAGSHCTFCPAAGLPCPALEKKALDAAGVWFDDADEPIIKNTPDMLSPERLARALDMADMIQNWLNACRALATRLVDTGVDIPGYQLVEKIGNRKFTLEGAALETALIEKTGVTKADIYNAPKAKSPAQIEKVLGAKRKHLIEGLVERPVTGVSLVSKEKTSKPAVANKVETFLNPLD